MSISKFLFGREEPKNKIWGNNIEISTTQKV